ncbi:MAG: extracellular solute-binding protein [Rhodospirillaceae bacterium]|nr:extracellular solute-binding protein [Rhodospirillaceae bacterium]
MSNFTRRNVLKTGAGLAATGALASKGLIRPAFAQDMSFTPEDGASLRVLRWSKFVQGDEDLFLQNVAKFTEMTGVQVQVDNESWEDVRPKAAVAANVGSGPDIIFGWYDDPHQYPDKLVDLTDLCDYLGGKYGGWFDAAQTYGMRDGRWIGMPWGASGNCLVYRKSWAEEAGFSEWPSDTEGLLEVMRAMSANGHPPGFALGNAVGDGNTWTHWALWSHGGKMVDENNTVVLNSPETIAALNYVKQMYETFIPGTISWLDPNNNRAFLSGQISLTANGISVFYAAKNSDDPAIREMADDIYHANMPIGPVGTHSELHLFTQAMVFNYTQYPNACKEFLRFIMEWDQYQPWQAAAEGYICHPLQAYDENPIWTADVRNTPYRDCIRNMLYNGYSGSLGYASAAAMADYIVVNMFAEAASGAKSPEDAAADAHRRAERYYRI